MGRVAFVTCESLERFFPSRANRLFTHDDQVAAAFLERAGLQVEPLCWGTPLEQIEAANYSLIVVRSPWDYMDTTEKRESFFVWIRTLEEAEFPLHNPPSLLRWNLDKHYLADLQQAAVEVVPTQFVEPGDALNLASIQKELGSFVVKPAISAAANDTYCFHRAEEASTFQSTFDELRGERSFLVQPFLPAVCEKGEWSLVYLDGTYSHAVLKRPAKGNWLVQDERGGSVISAEPPEEIREVANQTFAKLPGEEPLYARIDIIPDEKLYVSEVELVEPELFFLTREAEGNSPNREALVLFQRGIERRIHSSASSASKGARASSNS